jgi:hypothetical protein
MRLFATVTPCGHVFRLQRYRWRTNDKESHMSGTNGLKVVAGIAFALAIGLGAFAFTEHNSITELTAQLAAATADAKQAHDTSSNLSGQLDAVTRDAHQAHVEAAGLQTKVQATEAQATAEAQQLQSTEARLAAEARPDLPISVSFRQALLSAGLVGVFRNTSGKELEFTLDLTSPATGQHVRRSAVINPNGVLQIGAQEGWAFAPGQRIMLNNPSYRPIVLTVGS